MSVHKYFKMGRWLLLVLGSTVIIPYLMMVDLMLMGIERWTRLRYPSSVAGAVLGSACLVTCILIFLTSRVGSHTTASSNELDYADTFPIMAQTMHKC